MFVFAYKLGAVGGANDFTALTGKFQFPSEER